MIQQLDLVYGGAIFSNPLKGWPRDQQDISTNPTISFYYLHNILILLAITIAITKTNFIILQRVHYGQNTTFKQTENLCSGHHVLLIQTGQGNHCWTGNLCSGSNRKQYYFSDMSCKSFCWCIVSIVGQNM